MRPALLFFAACLLTGCFSAEDFALCTRAGDRCAEDRICTASGECLPPPPSVDADVPDEAPPSAPADEGVVEPIDIMDEIPPTLEAEGRVVRIHAGRLLGSSTRIVAARIEVLGFIDADGLGRPGGSGGGGGAAGTQGAATQPGREGSPMAAAGREASGVLGGDGGRGAPGSEPEFAGGLGGDPDTLNGQAGGEARFPVSCDGIGAVRPVLGGGGGGGGGGRGATVGAEVCTGSGGGGGGAGGPGGGAILLIATERIVIKGVLSARGLPAPEEGGSPGQPVCAACDQCPEGAGNGGDGSAEGGPGGAGDDDAGRGGRGGAGSGGMVLLQAPIIEFDPAGGVVVEGGGSDGSNGLVALRGELMGSEPLLEGVGTRCDR